MIFYLFHLSSFIVINYYNFLCKVAVESSPSFRALKLRSFEVDKLTIRFSGYFMCILFYNHPIAFAIIDCEALGSIERRFIRILGAVLRPSFFCEPMQIFTSFSQAKKINSNNLLTFSSALFSFLFCFWGFLTKSCGDLIFFSVKSVKKSGNRVDKRNSRQWFWRPRFCWTVFLGPRG